MTVRFQSADPAALRAPLRIDGRQPTGGVHHEFLPDPRPRRPARGCRCGQPGRADLAAGRGRALGRGDPRRRRPGYVRDLPDHARPVRDGRPAAALRARRRRDRSARSTRCWPTRPTETRDPARPWLLAPIDLQAIKAAGVTFAISMLERVIEERARGDMNAAGAIRAEVAAPGRRRPQQAEARLRPRRCT